MKKEPYVCWDCGHEIKVEGKIIKGGKLLKYKDDDKERLVLKCDECFAKNPALNNYQETEVYSRIVGYLRPVNQWNIGKQEEFRQRKTYRIKVGN